MKEIRELTGIRFFAAFHVLLFHNFYIAGELFHGAPEFLIRLFSFGDYAVSFFFILSGFILTYVYCKDEKLKGTTKSFWWARFSRLYPVYFLALVMDLPRGLSYFLGKYDLTQALIKIGISLGGYTTMLQSWYPRITPTWNSPAWSLSVEAFFYLVFPFCLPFLIKSKHTLKWLSCLYLVPIMAFFIFKLAGFDFESAHGATLWRSLPLIRVPEFLIGIILGKLFLEKGRFINFLEENKIQTSLLFWGVLLFSLLCVSLKVDLPREIHMNVLLVPSFALMILCLSCQQVYGASFFTNQPMNLLGHASFTLYIIHQPVLFYVSKLGMEKGATYFLLYSIITIMLSIIIHKAVELPAQKWLRSRSPFKN